MSASQDMADLLRVKRVLEQLRIIDPTTLTQREREVWQEARERAYTQAASLLAAHFCGFPSERKVHRHADQ
ncbi:MAG TPA: hypothetical protein VEL31_15545 [Ktedonobacteraceae bacterium]|nr:hypothetical protein [Ktedonobacteraceae bacterium]